MHAEGPRRQVAWPWEQAGTALNGAVLAHQPRPGQTSTAVALDLIDQGSNCPRR
jgi:hypothetical protein